MAKKLKEYCTVISGYAFKSKDLSEGTDIPVIKIGNISNGGNIVIDNSTQYVKKEFLAIDEKYHIKNGDILISLTGSHMNQPNSMVGRCCRNLDNTVYLLNQRAGKIIPKKTIVRDFLYYVFRLQSIQYAIANRAYGGANQVNVSPKDVMGIKFNIPDIAVQKKIAKVFVAYDSLIENNKKRIRLLEQMAESLYKEWFVRFRFSGYEDVEFENGFPKDWGKVKLDDVLNKIATGLNPRKNFVLGEGENFYVTIKNMADNTVYLDNKCDKVNDDAIIKINKRSDLKIGDLLFSGIGTIGRVCLIDIPTNNWNISESVFTMRANKKISSEFLFMLLLSQDVQNYCQSKANGSAQKGIRMGDLRKYTFLLPTKNVINDFTNQISPILRNVSLLRNENNNLIQQRDLLLPRLMSGKLEV